MSQIDEIARKISALSPDELRELRPWFEEYLADEWDRQIERNVRAGRLDHVLAEEAAVPEDDLTPL